MDRINIGLILFKISKQRDQTKIFRMKHGDGKRLRRSNTRLHGLSKGEGKTAGNT